MKKVTVDTLVFRALPFMQADSVKEFNELAGNEEACLDEANANIAYRGQLPAFQDSFAEYLEANYSMKRIETPTSFKEDGKTPKTKKVETVVNFIKRICSEKGLSVADFEKTHRAKAEELSLATAFNPKAAERKGPGIAKVYTITATALFAGDEADREAVFTMLERVLERPIERTVEALAKAISDKETKSNSLAAALLAQANG